MDFLPHPAQLEAIQGLDGRLSLAPRGTKGCEVVSAHQRRGSSRHALQLQLPRHPPNPVAIENRRCGAHENAVAVVACARTAPRIEAVGRKAAIEYRHGLGLEMEINRRTHGSDPPDPRRSARG